MLQNQSNVLTIYEIPSSFSSVPSFQGVQTTGKALEAVENVTLKSGEVALVHEYGVSGFSTQNFLYQQVNVPGIVTHSNSTTSYYSSSTLSVTPDQGYQLQFTPWFGIQNQPVNSVESTSWKVLPYWQNGQLVVNSTGANYNQYIAWRYSPTSNVINITIHITSFPALNSNPGITIYSSNIGDQTGDANLGFYMLSVDFAGGYIYFHSPSYGLIQLYTSLPYHNYNYPFTFSVILTENSAGNVTVQSVYINGTAYSVNVNTPFPWSQIGYIGIRGDGGNLFYVSYFDISPFQYGVVKYTVNSVSLPSMPDTSSATVLISQLSNGSYAILGVYNGTWHELNLPFTNPGGKFTVTFNPVGPVNITLKSSNVLSYGALFSPGNGVLLEAQNAIPPSNPTAWEPLGYVGTNGEVGGGADYPSPQFTPATLNSINYYQGGTIATTDWGTTNFTYYSASINQNLNEPMNYVTVGTVSYTHLTLPTILRV